MGPKASALGDYLRARREQVRPEDVGLATGVRRRVAGLYVNWDEATEIAVSGSHEVAGSDMDDPRLRALIDELSAASQRFRELWARADVGYRPGIIHMRHPQVGDLYLHRSRLNVPYQGGQHLLIFYAEPGSESAEAPTSPSTSPKPLPD